ncbi:MAG: NUDIX hydrolase [Pseudomonadota bacterium]
MNSPLLCLADVESRVSTFDPVEPVVGDQTRQAAVAAILRETGQDLEALFILRATKEGDPWSGHMAFPGGHKEAVDSSLRDTAERETLEEIGLDLKRTARFCGIIEPVRANPRGRNIDMVVQPYVYVLTEPEPRFTMNYEVADILWGSLNDMYSGNSFTHDEFEVGGQTLSFPGYSVGEHVVWGLTLRMLDQFFTLIDPTFSTRYE